MSLSTRTLMRHELHFSTTITVALLSIRVIAAPEVRRLVTSTGIPNLQAASGATGFGGAIANAVITRPTDRERRATTTTTTRAELHP